MPEQRSTPPALTGDFTFGDWLVQPSLNRIQRGTEVFKLRPQLMDLLASLAAKAGRTVTKDEILDGVWPGQFIAESGLTRCVAELRQVLGDTAGHEAKYIETIPKRGYRLIAPVVILPDNTGVTPATARETHQAVMAPPSAASGPGDVQESAVGLEVVPPAAAADVPRVKGRGLLSNRRTRRVVIAAALLVVLSASFAAWRTWRQPPFLGERDVLVVVFENLTGEAVFDETLSRALKIQLEQSPYLRIVSDQRIREQLAFMNRPPDTVLTRDLGREVCQREGAKAMLAGMLVSLGKHYVIGLEGVDCQSGDTLVRNQVEVEGRESVLGGLDRMASSVRRQFGESVASIGRYNMPISQATTPSLDALKAFSLGDLARSRGDDADAVEFYRRAIELDRSFALAHVRLGLHLVNLSRFGEGMAALRAAYAVRERANSGERLYITGSYQSRALRDPIQALESFKAWRDAYPNNAIARFSLASMYAQTGRQEDAVVEAREALRLDPDNTIAGTVLCQSLVALGRKDEARDQIAQLLARRPSSVLLHWAQLDLAVLTDDDDAVRRQLEWASTTPAAAPLFVSLERGLALVAGRLREAKRQAERKAALGDQQNDPSVGAGAWLDYLTQAAMLGATRDTAAQVERALLRARSPDILVDAALAMAWAGQPDTAEQYLREYQDMPGVVPGSDRRSRLCSTALIALARGRADTAVDVLAPLRPYDYGNRFGFEPSYIRGLALQRLGRGPEARIEFERIVARRGVSLYSVVYPLALVQLGRAKALAGDVRGSRAAYEQALRCWKDADPDVPLIERARGELRALPPSS